jgi:hypothetical protein
MWGEAASRSQKIFEMKYPPASDLVIPVKHGIVLEKGMSSVFLDLRRTGSETTWLVGRWDPDDACLWWTWWWLAIASWRIRGVDIRPGGRWRRVERAEGRVDHSSWTRQSSQTTAWCRMEASGGRLSIGIGDRVVLGRWEDGKMGRIWRYKRRREKGREKSKREE